VTREGRPEANVVVSVAAVDGEPMRATTTTSATGEYEFANLPDGNYTLSVAPLPAVAIKVERAIVKDFVLPPLDLSGQLADAATQQPLFLASITLHDTSGTVRRSTSTDQRGRFSFTALNAGDYWITAQSDRPGYDVNPQRIALSSSQSELTLSLAKTDGVPLRLRTAATDLEGVEIQVFADGMQIASIGRRMDANGVVKLPPGLAGRELHLSARGHAPVVIDNWSGSSLEIELRQIDTK
jgi:hypothetical protein